MKTVMMLGAATAALMTAVSVAAQDDSTEMTTESDPAGEAEVVQDSGTGSTEEPTTADLLPESDGGETETAAGEDMTEDTMTETAGETADTEEETETAGDAAEPMNDETETAGEAGEEDMQQTAEEAAPGGALEAAGLTSEDLVGVRVLSGTQKDIGEISRVLFTSQGNMEAAVVDVGGFLGFGEHRVALPIGQLQIEGSGIDDVTVAVGMTKDELLSMPEYDPAQ